MLGNAFMLYNIFIYYFIVQVILTLVVSLVSALLFCPSDVAICAIDIDYVDDFVDADNNLMYPVTMNS